MASKQLINAVNGYENYIKKNGIDEQVINAYVDACSVAINGEKDVEYGLQLTERAKDIIERFCKDKTGGTIWDLEKYAFDHKTAYDLINKKYEILLLEAQNKIVDSYFQYIEKKREPKDRFYMPRRKQLIKIGLVDALQGMIDDKYDILCVSLVPGAGKSTIEKFFHSAVAGWFPKDYSLFYSHSGDITRMYYDGVYDIVTNDDDYAWHDIFPNLSVTSTNAKMEQFNIGKYKPFPSVQCTSVGSKNAGKVRASKFLLVDDMIGGIEEALNPIVVDYLQLLMPDNRYSGRNEEVASISRGLKSVARDLNTHVIALSQITRASESRDTKEPAMAELRESGAIEQDASNIIMLWNLSDNDKGAKGVKIEKNRQGMTMREAMEFDGDHMKFVEIEKPFNDVVAEIKKKERGDGFKPYNGDCPF